MKLITKATVNRINEIKKANEETYFFNATLSEIIICEIWDKIFVDLGIFGTNLESLENEFEVSISTSYKEKGIFGLEIITKGNVRYIGTNDISTLMIKDFNKFVKEAIF